MSLIHAIGISLLGIGSIVTLGSTGCKPRKSNGQLESTQSQSQTTILNKDQFASKLREWYLENIEPDKNISAEDFMGLEVLFKQFKGDLYSIMDFSKLIHTNSKAPRNVVNNEYFSLNELESIHVREDDFYFLALANAFDSAPILSDLTILKDLKLSEKPIAYAKSTRRAYSYIGAKDKFQLEVSVVPNLSAEGGYALYSSHSNGQSMNLSTEMQNQINSMLPLPEHIKCKNGHLIAFENESLIGVISPYAGNEGIKEIGEKLRRVGFLTDKPDKDIVSKEIHHQKYFPILLLDTQLTLKALLELGASEDDKSLYLESRLYQLVEFSLGKLTLAAVTSAVEKSPEKIDQIEYDKIKSNIDRELNGSRRTL